MLTKFLVTIGPHLVIVQQPVTTHTKMKKKFIVESVNWIFGGNHSTP